MFSTEKELKFLMMEAYTTVIGISKSNTEKVGLLMLKETKDIVNGNKGSLYNILMRMKPLLKNWANKIYQKNQEIHHRSISFNKKQSAMKKTLMIMPQANIHQLIAHQIQGLSEKLKEVLQLQLPEKGDR